MNVKENIPLKRKRYIMDNGSSCTTIDVLPLFCRTMNIQQPLLHKWISSFQSQAELKRAQHTNYKAADWKEWNTHKAMPLQNQ